MTEKQEALAIWPSNGNTKQTWGELIDMLMCSYFPIIQGTGLPHYNVIFGVHRKGPCYK